MNAEIQEAAKYLTADLVAQIELYVLEQGPLRIEQTPDGARFVAKQDLSLRLKDAAEIREQAIRECIKSLETMLDEDPCDCERCRAFTTAQAIMRALLEGSE